MSFTLVTGLWNMGRDQLGDFGRPFDHYLERFKELLSLDFPMVIYIPKELELFVADNRSPFNTVMIFKELKDFKEYCPWYEKIQTIRKNESWLSQADWLRNSPQAALEYYNPVVMSKFFMLNDAAIHNHFNSKYLFWIDAGLTNTVGLDQLKNMEKLPSYMADKKFTFLSFPYDTDSEVHGYRSQEFDDACGKKSTYVCRGGFFGGDKKYFHSLNNQYYAIAQESFNQNVMGTEECFHTILSHKASVTRFELGDDGLVYPFFDMLGQLETLPEEPTNVDLIPYDKKKDIEDIKTTLYVLSFNSPKQFEKLIKSWFAFGFKRKILIDNSTDKSTYAEYQRLCKEYGYEHIKKEKNVGICGGRQFIAEHFNESDSEYYLFLEDDMLLHDKTLEKDQFGFPKYVDDLYIKSLAIMHMNRYDYLKLSFAEFYGDNSGQWSWYNISQQVREQYFPENNLLPKEGLSDKLPELIPEQRKRYKGLSYLEGEYYYCNWPLWFSRQGNRKVFLDNRLDNPYEQMWMANVFLLQKQNKIKAAVLEASPINHHRFDFYPAEDRVES